MAIIKDSELMGDGKHGSIGLWSFMTMSEVDLAKRRNRCCNCGSVRPNVARIFHDYLGMEVRNFMF